MLIIYRAPSISQSLETHVFNLYVIGWQREALQTQFSQRHRCAGYEDRECERRLAACRKMQWKPTRIWGVSTDPLIWFKLGNIGKRLTERGRCHLPASGLMRRACRDRQNFGALSLTFSPSPGSECKVSC